MEISSLGNLYFQEETPWKTIKLDPVRTGVVVAVGINIVNLIAELISPYLPSFASQLVKQMQLNEDELAIQDQFVFEIKAGHKIGKPQPIILMIPVEKEEEWKDKFGPWENDEDKEHKLEKWRIRDEEAAKGLIAIPQKSRKQKKNQAKKQSFQQKRREEEEQSGFYLQSLTDQEKENVANDIKKCLEALIDKHAVDKNEVELFYKFGQRDLFIGSEKFLENKFKIPILHYSLLPHYHLSIASENVESGKYNFGVILAKVACVVDAEEIKKIYPDFSQEFIRKIELILAQRNRKHLTEILQKDNGIFKFKLDEKEVVLKLGDSVFASAHDLAHKRKKTS